MSEDYYMINMQKLLYIANELHIRGFEKLRVIPSLSPSGGSWRCSYRLDSDSEKEYVWSTNWIHEVLDVEEKSEYSIKQLTDIFEKEYFDFLQLCKGENKEYVEWYSNMLNKLKEGELPYAYSDFSDPIDHWDTSEEQKIKTLPNDKRFYNID